VLVGGFEGSPAALPGGPADEAPGAPGSDDGDDELRAFLRAREAGRRRSRGAGRRLRDCGGPAEDGGGAPGAEAAGAEAAGSGRAKRARRAGPGEGERAAARAAREEEKRRRAAERERARAEREVRREEERRERELSRLQQQLLGKERRHEALTCVVSSLLAATKVGRTVMDALEGAEPRFSFAVREDATWAPGGRGLPTVRFEYACEVVAAADGAGAAVHAPSKLQAVPYVMVVLDAPLLFAHAREHGLSGIVDKARQLAPASTLCLLLVGADAFARRCAREGWPEGPALVQDALVRLATANPGVRVAQCVDASEAGEHLHRVCKALCQAPFHERSLLSATAGRERVRLNLVEGADRPLAATVRALSLLSSMSEENALAIARGFPSLASLQRRFLDESAPERDRAQLLVGVRGEGTRRGVGAGMSRRLMHFLTCDDPDAVLNV